MKEIKYSEKGKVYQDMSLVGIIKINNGIIAFGDSKSTLYDINGSPYWDKDRITQKVFVNKCFLLTTYGINTCMISGKMVYLENVLNEAIKDDYSHEQEFLQNIHNQIKETYIKYPDNHYRFIIGRKDIHNQFYIAVYTLNKDGVFCDSFFTI